MLLPKIRSFQLCVLFAALLSSLKGELIISEFLAMNSGTEITDEDNFPADWIEIHNPDTTSVNLAGYALTDDPANLGKWIFPSVTLSAGEYLRVFATGKDRKIDNNFLHTNFSLDGDGEYLALVRPDGSTIADGFSPQYPPQLEDISYGISFVTSTLLPVGSPLSYLVPASDIGETWKTPGFDDSSWTASASAIGFNYGVDNPEAAATISANGDVESIMKRINASIYLRMPFELTDPAAVQKLTLKAKVDDGFVAFLNGAEVASKNKPTPLTFNSTAAGSDEVTPGEDFEIFELDIAGHLVSGENILAIQLMNSTAGNNDLIFIPELEIGIRQLTAPIPRAYFEEPSPGAPNTNPKSAPPSGIDFDVTSRAFTDDFQLNLSLIVAEPEATIHFTTDGSEVTETSPAYSAPIEVDGSTLVRARAFIPGAIAGPGRTEAYIKLASSEADFSSDLPVVLLSTFGKGSAPGSSTNTLRGVFMLIYEPDPVTGRTTLSGEPSLSTRGGYRRRGSSSAGWPKYGIRFESWDEHDEDQDISPLGFAPEADWILNSRYEFDRSLMRNPFTYQLSNEIGRWAVKTRFVELYNDDDGSIADLDGTDYFGVYCFMERIEADDDRLDIAGLDPWENSEEERTGGYIVKRDRGSPSFSVSGLSGGLVYVDPDLVDLTPEQDSYIKTHTNEVWGALTSANGINSSTGLHFSDYLDVDSFVDNFWINTLVMDPDWGRLSQFFHKDRNGKINAGPVWDYDRTMGSRDSRDNNPLAWQGPPDASKAWWDTRYQWFGRLFGFSGDVSSAQTPQLLTSRPDVFQKIIDRWYELRADQFSQANIDAIIDTFAGELDEAQARSFARWPEKSPGGITGNNYAASGTSGWYREVSHLKGWLKARSEWIDDQFFTPPTFNQIGGEVSENFQLVMSASNGNVYYTTDGSDPRAPGGTPSATSTQGVNVTLTETATVVARAYDGQQWGAPTRATFVIGGEQADSSNLVISEIMYDPAPPTAAEELAGFTSDSFFEYLEIYNPTATTVDLTEVTFTDGIEFSFATSNITSLAPGARALIVRSATGFAQRYGSSLNSLIAGEFENGSGLSGSGERITLEGANGTIADITYNDKFPWPKSSNGEGPSLVYIKGQNDPGLPQSWRPSVETLGNPGEDDATTFSGVADTDLDNDGLNAFAEYALGTSESSPNSSVLIGSIDANGRYALTFPRNIAADDAEIILQISSDLNSWSLASESLEDGKETHNSDGTVTYTFRTPDTATTNLRLFGRLFITQR